MTEKRKVGCRRGCFVSVAVLVLGFAGLIGLGIMYNRQFKNAAEAYFEAVQIGDFDRAYDLTSTPFQKKFTQDEMSSFLNKSGLSRYASAKWDNLTDGEEGHSAILGAVELDDGTSIPIRVTMISEQGEMRIFSIDQYNPEEEAQRQAEEAPLAADNSDGVSRQKTERKAGWSWKWSYSTATLSDPVLTLSTTEAPLKPTTVFSPEDKELFCRVKLSWAPNDTKITTKWIFLEGPEIELKNHVVVSAELIASGNMPVTASFARGPAPLPIGSYVVKFFIDGKPKLEVPFTVERQE